MLHTRTVREKTLFREGIIFLASFSVFGGILYLLTRPLEIVLQTLLSAHVQRGLELIGTTTIAQSPIRFWAENNLIEITPLCAGLLEIILLAAAILATRGVSVRKKIKGIIVGGIVLYAFNVLRIIFTVQQIVHTPLSFAELTHDVLFRLILLAGFAAAYYMWLKWATRANALSGKNASPFGE